MRLRSEPTPSLFFRPEALRGLEALSAPHFDGGSAARPRTLRRSLTYGLSLPAAFRRPSPMAHLLYAVCGQGRGHSSRVLAMTEELEAHGHTVTLACGGTARAVFEALGRPVVALPALTEVVGGNRLRLGATMRHNAATVLGAPRLVRALARRLDRLAPDLLVTDFEPFMPRAAARVGLPVVSLNHQEVLTEAAPGALPAHDTLGQALHGALVRAAIRVIAPRHPRHRVVTALAPVPLWRPEATTLVGPVLRRAVRAAVPHRGRHLVAYFNGTRGLDAPLAALGTAGMPVRVYGTGHTGTQGALTFCAPSLDGFLADLATSRGVVATAGFTLLCESLALGKPVLALPHTGDAEQTFNARLLDRLGAGHSVYRRPLAPADVRAFLDRFDGAFAPPAGVLAPGHRAAVQRLESCLAAPVSAPAPPLSTRSSVLARA